VLGRSWVGKGRFVGGFGFCVGGADLVGDDMLAALDLCHFLHQTSPPAVGELATDSRCASKPRPLIPFPAVETLNN
jgi:hypothetical protein